MNTEKLTYIDKVWKFNKYSLYHVRMKSTDFRQNYELQALI